MREQPSIYTPSNSSPELLESIFVQREKLLANTVRRLEKSLLTNANYHPMFVGARGSGKTHFLTMAVNRLKKLDSLADKMVIVWLGEDNIITSYLDFILSILETLHKNNQEEFNVDVLNSLAKLEEFEIENVIMASICEQLGNKKILLVKENLSDVFKGLTKIGQHKLRAFLQEKNNMVVLSSSQLLFEGISSRDEAFYGFFDVSHLTPLTVEDAKQLLINIADLKGDKELVEFINSPQGIYRVRSIHYLAGGNHRLYISLSEYLNKDSLDNLVDALVKLVEELTPYFQERIRALPLQQGKIIQKMCELQGAFPVKEIAARTITINEKSLAKQLGDLARIKYVIKHKRGRQSYYEIAEPLMRLSLEVKNAHGKPLKMLLQLIRAWFSDDSIKDSLESCTSELQKKYLQESLGVDKDLQSEVVLRLKKEFKLAGESEDIEEQISLSEQIVEATKDSSDEESLLVLNIFQVTLILLYVQNNRFSEMVSVVFSLRFKTFSKKSSHNYSNFLAHLAPFVLSYSSNKSDDLLEFCLKIEANYKSFLDEKQLLQLNLVKASCYIKVDNFLQAKNILLDVSKDSLDGFLSLEIIFSVLKSPSCKWQEQVSWLAEFYIKNNKKNLLPVAIFQSLHNFVKDKTLQSYLYEWVKCWEVALRNYPELFFAANALSLSAEAVISGTDKPLLALPQELRALVLPLIDSAFDNKKIFVASDLV